jgi:hypothetical protein
MEVAQGEGEVICAGPCVEGGDGWSAMTAWRSKAGLRRGGSREGPRQERGEGSEPVLKSRHDLTMEASVVKVKGQALVLHLAVEERGRLVTLISGGSGRRGPGRSCGAGG